MQTVHAMPRPGSSRLIRLSRHSPPHSQKQKQTHEHRACIYGLLTVILLFCTLAIFEAKIGNPPLQIKDQSNKLHHLGRRSISAFPQVRFSGHQIPHPRAVAQGKETSRRQGVEGEVTHQHQAVHEELGADTFDIDDRHRYGSVEDLLGTDKKEDFHLVSLKNGMDDGVKIGNVSSVLGKEADDDEEEEEEEEEENDESVDVDGDLDVEEDVQRSLGEDGVDEDGKEKEDYKEDDRDGEQNEESSEESVHRSLGEERLDWDGKEKESYEEDDKDGVQNEEIGKEKDRDRNGEKDEERREQKESTREELERALVDEGDNDDDETLKKIPVDEGGNDKKSLKSNVEKERKEKNDGSASQTTEHIPIISIDSIEMLVNRTAQGSIREESSDDMHVNAKAMNGVERRALQVLPRWDPLEDMGGRHKSSYLSSNGQSKSINKAIIRSSSHQQAGIVWDHMLGVVRRGANYRSSTNQLISRVKTRSGDKKFQHTDLSSGCRNGNIGDKCSLIFSSDDEPVDEDIRDTVSQITGIEDALLLVNNKRLWAEKKPSKADSNRKDRSVKAPIDPLNPANNPLLQDPDTFAGSGLSGGDKVILKALQRSQTQRPIIKTGNKEEYHGNAETVVSGKKTETGAIDDTSTMENGKRIGRSVLEALTSDSLRPSEVIKEHFVPQSGDMPSGRTLIRRKWGFFPGLDPTLTFTKFLEQFFGSNKCDINVFMAWTTSPSSYTVRHQRGLESLFYFHPKACVVVFSETIGFDFFKSFVVDGFKVAVLRPNLEDLLEGTQADVAASVWLTWRNMPLFHIHYTEFLRLAVLYKYGGAYLDTDVILLKPLDLLHNTVCKEMLKDTKTRLNGAVMAFDKGSPFLLQCMAEFTATYNGELLDYNGAELLTRVAHATRISIGDSTQPPGKSYIKSHECLFPLSSEKISRYFAAPVTEHQQQETDQSLELILNHSLTFHLWNQRTQRLIPQVGSLVERIMNYHCIKCDEYR